MTSVTSHTPRKPDKRMMGYLFPGRMYEGKTPLDYVVDPKTGLMEQGNQAQWSISKQDLRKGIEEAVIPPVFIWERGRWLAEFKGNNHPLDQVEVHGFSAKENRDANWDFYIWVTHGEGSPGAFAFRAYLLPERRANESQVPKHPVMWTKKEKEGKSELFVAKTHWRWDKRPNDPKTSYHNSWLLLEKGEILYSGTTGYGSPAAQIAAQANTVKPPVAVPKPTQSPGLPTGVKFRCGACGHWFTEHNLKGHVDSVCPGRNPDSDWAVMCDDKCGCEMIAGFPTESHELGSKTLDHPSSCKPGFPRPKKAVAKEAVAEGGDAVVEAKLDAEAPGVEIEVVVT